MLAIAQTLKGWQIQPPAPCYANVELTLGGIDTDALSKQTLAVRTVPDLYFIGEVFVVNDGLDDYRY